MTATALPLPNQFARARAQFQGAASTLAFKWDPLRFGMFALTILTVSRIHQRYPLFAKTKPLLVLVAMCFLYSFANPKSLSTDSVFKSWPMRLVVFMAVLACLSVPFGISMGNSGKFILDVFSRTLVYAGLLALAIRSASDLYMFMWAYVWATLILCWLSIFVLKMTTYTDVTRLANLYTYDANDVGLVVLVGLVFSLALLQVAGPKGKMIALTAIIGVGGTIARSGSRGAFLGLVCVAFALLVRARGVSVVKRMMFMVVVGAGITYWAPPGYWKQMQTLLQPTDDYNWQGSEGRKAIFLRGMGYMMDRPLSGLGINNFSRAECIDGQKAQRHQVGTGIRCTPPHNSYAQVGAELGIPGMLLWILMMWRGVVTVGRISRQVPEAWKKGTQIERFLYIAPNYLSVSMVGFAVSSFFLTFAWMDILYLQMALIAGLYTALKVKLRDEAMKQAMPAPAQGATVRAAEYVPLPLREPILAPFRASLPPRTSSA